MGENTYASVVPCVNLIRNSNQPDDYRALVEKLIYLEPNDWLKFQKLLKNLHSAEIHQTESQTEILHSKQREIQWNKEKKTTENLLRKHKYSFKKYKNSYKTVVILAKERHWEHKKVDRKT